MPLTLLTYIKFKLRSSFPYDVELMPILEVHAFHTAYLKNDEWVQTARSCGSRVRCSITELVYLSTPQTALHIERYKRFLSRSHKISRFRLYFYIIKYNVLFRNVITCTKTCVYIIVGYHMRNRSHGLMQKIKARTM